MSNPFQDETETADPKRRTYFERAEWHGRIYKDAEGQERCPSQWHFPCGYCHAKKQPSELSALAGAKLGAMPAVPAIVPVVLTEDEQSNMERDALDAHREDPPSEQYVYTRG